MANNIQVVVPYNCIAVFCFKTPDDSWFYNDYMIFTGQTIRFDHFNEGINERHSRLYVLPKGAVSDIIPIHNPLNEKQVDLIRVQNLKGKASVKKVAFGVSNHDWLYLKNKELTLSDEWLRAAVDLSKKNGLSLFKLVAAMQEVSRGARPKTDLQKTANELLNAG